ncbi:MAG TPA: hypothetical protein ENF55_00415 [Thermoprotei archaeon]|nr:hypothetical protein [Thermoprotei archaeon]
MGIKVAFIPLFHSDYPFEIAKRFVKKAVDRLRERGVEILLCKEVCERNSVREVVKSVASYRPDSTVLFVATWIEAPNAVSLALELSQYPLIVWGLRMYYEDDKRESTGSLPGASVLKASLEAVGLKPFFIVGMPDEIDTIDKVYTICLASSVARRIREARIGLVGYASMGMYTAMFDPFSLRKVFGIDVAHIDTSEVFKEVDRVKEDEIMSVIDSWLRKYFIESDVSREDLVKAAKIYIALKNLVKKYKLSSLTVKCQYEFSKDLGFVPCVPLSVLADEGVVSSCEGDIPLTLTMLILHYLTNQPIYYGDLVDIRGNKVYLSSCGFAPLTLSAEKTMGIGRHKYFFRGLRSGIVLKKGEVTLARIGLISGEYRLHVALGEVVETELRQGLFPAAEVELKGEVEAFIENIMSQHYALAYGDLRKYLRILTRIFGIKYIET